MRLHERRRRVKGKSKTSVLDCVSAGEVFLQNKSPLFKDIFRLERRSIQLSIQAPQSSSGTPFKTHLQPVRPSRVTHL